MKKEQHRPEIEPTHCDFISDVEGASLNFEEEIEDFLETVRQTINHMILEGCKECEEYLNNAYQIPEGCNNPLFGHRVLIHKPLFVDKASMSLEQALTVMLIDDPDLEKTLLHVKDCDGCIKLVNEYLAGE